MNSTVFTIITNINISDTIGTPWLSFHPHEWYVYKHRARSNIRTNFAHCINWWNPLSREKHFLSSSLSSSESVTDALLSLISCLLVSPFHWCSKFLSHLMFCSNPFGKYCPLSFKILAPFFLASQIRLQFSETIVNF